MGITDFQIHQSFIGSPKHLLFQDEKIQFISHFKNDIWTLFLEPNLNSNWCLNSLFRLNLTEMELKPPEKFFLPFSRKDNLPYSKIMPTWAYKKYLQETVAQIKNFLVYAETNYYQNVFIKQNQLLNELVAPKINLDVLQAIIQNEQLSATHPLRTLECDLNGFGEVIGYSRHDVITGRLKVNRGLGVLTLKKEHRKIFTSRFGDEGKIVSFDFSSLEPRILLYEAGKNCLHQDLYDFFNQEIFDGKATREQAKKATLITLYSDTSQTKNRGVQKLRNYLEIDNLIKRIKNEYIQNQFIHNRYGRKIKINEPLDNIFLNYYTQSTGSDVSLLGFNQLYHEIKNELVQPLFLIMDELYLDCHNSQLEKLKTIKDLQISGYVQKFPVKMKMM